MSAILQASDYAGHQVRLLGGYLNFTLILEEETGAGNAALFVLISFEPLHILI